MLCRPMAKYKVPVISFNINDGTFLKARRTSPVRVDRYIRVKGSLSLLNKCFKWLQGPHMKEKLEVKSNI